MASKAFAMIALAMIGASPVCAQSPAEFYRGKTVFLQVGSGPGGIYDIVGRMVGRHIGKYIPGEPRIVIQNIPGGGSLQLANQFGAITARDGTAFGVFNNGMPTTPLLDPAAGKFDPKKFQFIGSPSREAHILVVWHDAPAKTFDDLFKVETILGASSPGAAPLDFPLLTNTLIGTKFKIVNGYPGGPDTLLAMQRGEIHGNGGLAWGSYKSDYRDVHEKKLVRILGAFGMRQHPELKDVPMFPTGKNEEERQLFQLMYARQDFGRPFAVPEGVPKDRVLALREAFAKTMRDPAFIAEAERANTEVDPVSGEELDALTQKLHATPPDVVKRMQQIINAAK
jgi:tripartite-type tricarboxylate transporter receptor subunit TctC